MDRKLLDGQWPDLLWSYLKYNVVQLCALGLDHTTEIIYFSGPDESYGLISQAMYFKIIIFVPGSDREYLMNHH